MQCISFLKFARLLLQLLGVSPTAASSSEQIIKENETFRVGVEDSFGVKVVKTRKHKSASSLWKTNKFNL